MQAVSPGMCACGCGAQPGAAARAEGGSSGSRGPRTRGCRGEQELRCGKAEPVVCWNVFVLIRLPFPSEGPAVRAGSARAEEQQHCWACICCRGASLSPNTSWGRDVRWEKSCGCPRYPGSVCQSHEPVQPTDLCAIQGLPRAGNPWAPRKRLPTPFSTVKVLSVL